MPSRSLRLAVVAVFAGFAGTAAAQSKPLPLKHAPEPTSAAITAGDLMTRLYIYADDSMMGRAAGTIYNMKATDYIAGELKRMGIQSAGDDGYFQALPLVSIRASSGGVLTVDGKQFHELTDWVPRNPHRFNDDQVIYGGMFNGDTTQLISMDAAAGKVVIVATPLGPNGKPTWNNMRQPTTRHFAKSAGVLIAGMDGMTPPDMPALVEFTSLIADPKDPQDFMMMLPQGFGYMTTAMADAMLGAPLTTAKPGQLGKTISGVTTYDTVKSPTPPRNVIGIIPGSDAKLKGEYVAIGAHNDHVGFAPGGAVDHDSLKAFNEVALPEGADSVPRTMTPDMVMQFQNKWQALKKIHEPRKDSIFNGADDDGSGTVATLEIAEYFSKAATKPKRSLIFVFHTGEELGLLGSLYFTANPTIPRDSIVAQLNMDMIGRGGAADATGKVAVPGPGGRMVLGPEIHGGPDYLQLVGSRRLSTELGDLIESVNKTEKAPLKFDYSIDANGHPSDIYCRSDHASYAAYGIPITFFTTGGHSDYHQVTDEPQYIEYDHMARVANMVKDVATAVANLDHRIVVDKPKPDPKVGCRQ